MNRKIIAIIAIVILILAVFKGRSRDISVDVSSAEKAVLSALRTQTGGKGDILFRGEDVWKKGKVRGKTINYIVRLDSPVSASELTKQIEDGLKDVKGARLTKTQYRGEGEKDESAYFEVRHGRNVILTLTLDNISPGWIEDEEKSAEELPTVALVLDDFGYTRKNLEALKDLDTPITIAVLPGAPYSGAVSSFAAENDVEVILHLPMESVREGVRVEKDTIVTGMDEESVKRILSHDLRTVASAKGVSNHQGSKATKDKDLMTIVLGDLKERGFFFFDSFTTRGSVVSEVAEKEGTLYLRRDLFIDEKTDEEYIKGQMAKLEKLARKRGYVAAIGHEKNETIKVLQEVIPQMKERGIRFVYLSEIVEIKNGNTGNRNIM